MLTEWKPVVGFENLYEVSSNGDIRSLDRWVRYGHGLRLIRGRILKQTVNTHGYYRVALGEKQRFRTKEVHRIVAVAFVPNPLRKGCVNHKDGRKTNNMVSNLEWVTHSENCQHAQDIGLNGARLSLKQKRAASINGKKSRKLSRNMVWQILSLNDSYGWGPAEIARRLGVSVNCVGTVLYRPNSYIEMKNAYRKTA